MLRSWNQGYSVQITAMDIHTRTVMITRHRPLVGVVSVDMKGGVMYLITKAF